MPDNGIPVFIGYDAREQVAAEVCAYSIRRRASRKVDIRFLKHKELRKSGHFTRPWLTAHNGVMTDLIDGKPFSTEFSHSRFLVPKLMGHNGWALFCDCDMLWLSDIAKLWELRKENYALMCVQHNHKPVTVEKMDDCEQARYFRKNWSSFMLFNCGHEANLKLTPEAVNFCKGSELHSLYWLENNLIGKLPYSYNYIASISPSLPVEEYPAVIHYTEGGPWFENCQNVTYAEKWIEEFEHWQANGTGNKVTHVPSVSYEAGR